MSAAAHPLNQVNQPQPPNISVVTPTLGRPQEVAELLDNLAAQELRPLELILVDGAAPGDARTERLAAAVQARPHQPFSCVYLRSGGGTALQRNAGIERARGDYVAFIDDDIRLAPDFLRTLRAVFERPDTSEVGGVTGYIDNQHLDAATSRRWRWYRRLRLFTVWEPGRYDYRTGYPINRYLQPPHDGLREIDCMGAGCALWRAEVFRAGLRFDPFFGGYGVLEDAHLALRARRRWRLLECGAAHCRHLRSPHGRARAREVARKTAVNYRFVFVDIVPQRTLRQELRFFAVQLFDLARIAGAVLRRPSRENFGASIGKIEGIAAALSMTRSVDARALTRRAGAAVPVPGAGALAEPTAHHDR